MSMIQSDLLLGQEGGAGYVVERSLRFNSSDSAFLSRVPSTNGNSNKFTFSAWLKLSKIPTALTSIIGGGASGIEFVIGFNSSAQFFMQEITGGGSTTYYNVTSTAVFRDPSSWYHITVALDTTEATGSNRIKLWVNGSAVQLNFNTIPSLNYSTLFADSTYKRGVGAISANHTNYAYLDGYLADVFYVDGQALTPSSFTEVSATTGQLIPKQYTGSFGTNGFWLPFSDNGASAALGTDYSGNGNTWTVNNISSTTGGPTSVVAASGGLPIYNTTDTYGATKGTGVRSDSFASSIVACFPLADSSGLISTDESPTGRTSGTKTRTLTSVSHSTAASKFYGGSANLTASTSRIDFGDSNDFSHLGSALTIEGWFYLTGTSGWLLGKASTGTGSSLVYEYGIVIDSGFIGLQASPDGTYINGNWAAYQAAPIPTGRWHHVALVLDGTTGTTFGSLYLNGVRVAREGGGYLPTNSVNTNAPLVIGSPSSDRVTCLGYVQDFRVYKGSAPKYTSNFNPPSPTQNPTIAAGCDSTVDTPTSSGTDTGVGGEVTGNYATFNPLASAGTFTNGNLDLDVPLSTDSSGLSTIGFPSSGKWYWETTVVTLGADSYIGISTGESRTSLGNSRYAYRIAGSFQGVPTPTSLPPTASAQASGDIVGVAYDVDNATLAFYKNGTLQGTITGVPANQYFALNYAYSTGTVAQRTINFGQRQWAYAAPSGFRPLVDTLLPAPVVAKPDQFFQTALWSGDGASTRTITIGFEPDLIWEKVRNNAQSHLWYDVVRGFGANKAIGSNSTIAEGSFGDNSGSGYVSGTTSTGFSIVKGTSSAGYMNDSGYTQVAWCWDAGSSTVTNTQGSITSQVRTNGYLSIVTYTAPSSGAWTVGHGLGVAPQFIITKSRSNAYSWGTYHVSVGNTGRLDLNSTGAVTTTQNSAWNNTSPTSTVFSMGSDWAGSGITYVAYCFAPVAGYSAMGSYVGNGSTTDGPFIYTGMRPRWLLIKNTSIGGSSSNWILHDTQRTPYNASTSVLFPNLSNAEATDISYAVDVLSNGFKLRYNNDNWNGSGYTYIYFAVAESPFQYARAR